MPQLFDDYWFMGGQSSESHEDVPVFVMCEKTLQGLFAHVAKANGADDNMCLQVVDDLNLLAHKRVVVKSDQELAVRSLFEAAQVIWQGELVPEVAPLADKDGNGSAENAVKVHEGSVRTLQSALQRLLVIDIDDRSLVMYWMVERTAPMHRGYPRGYDGKTLWERARGKSSQKPIVEFGERVMAKPLSIVEPDNTQMRFQ